jgi:hypothetical protein
MKSPQRSEVFRLAGRAAHLQVQLDRLWKKYHEIQHWDGLVSSDSQQPSSQPYASPTRPIASPEAASTYQYIALTSPNSLRLLKALPPTRDGSVEVELSEAQELTPYRCLSYTWGDQSCQLPILLNGCIALVGANLLSFLEMAAQRFPGQAFWIDALCINQFDDDEKSVQVQRMGSIYQHADDVLIWLGHHEGIIALYEWADKPRSTISRAMVKRMPQHLQRNVIELVKHPYWGRAWVKQEMMLAREIRIACGPVSIQPNTLLRCIDTPMLIKWNSGESLVCAGLERRLRPMIIKQQWKSSVPLHFWQVFQLSGETPNCSNPRDRIYSILTVTGQDASFTVDYGEDVVSLFWRCLKHFAPEVDPAKVQRLWDLLELTPRAMEDAVEAKGSPFQIYIPMRRTRIRPDIRRQIPSFFHLRRTGLCGHDVYSFTRAQIQGYSRHDILLCPGTSDALSAKGMEGEEIDLEGIHVLVHPMKPPGDGFTFTILNTTYGRLPQPEGTELWSNIDGIESKIQRWSEVARIADVSGFSSRDDHEWKSRPHFMLKLSHLYFVECIGFMQSFWKLQFGRSWTSWPQADKVVNAALSRIA